MVGRSTSRPLISVFNGSTLPGSRRFSQTAITAVAAKPPQSAPMKNQPPNSVDEPLVDLPPDQVLGADVVHEAGGRRDAGPEPMPPPPR